MSKMLIDIKLLYKKIMLLCDRTCHNRNFTKPVI